MKLLELHLKNFKGIKTLDLTPNGRNLRISGKNATGKTTVADSFSWLLFGKDSLDSAKFSLKPISENGEAEHGLEHEVSALIDTGTETINFRRVLSEKWTKPRGQAQAIFGGHNTVYFIDGVPASESDYKSRIAAIAPESTFKLLTNPRYFSESKDFDWQKRRRLILDVCGDITDEDVIASDPKLARLPEILGKHSLEDYRKILASEKTRLNAQLQQIPVRISEQTRSIVPTELNPEEIVELQTHKSGLDTQLATLESGGTVSEKKRKLAEIETQLIRIGNESARARNERQEADMAALGKLKFSVGNLRTETGRLLSDIMSSKTTITQHTEGMAKLRAEYAEARGLVFELPEGGDICPTCGQAMPEAMIENARATFNINRAEKLAGINAEGKGLKDLCTEIEAAIAAHEAKRTALHSEIAKLEEEIYALQNGIENPAVHPERPEITILENTKTALLDEISKITENRAGAIAALKAQIAATKTEIETLQGAAAQVDQNKKSSARIDDLKKEERTLSAEAERIEGELFLTEEFVRTKVKMLEGKINSRFQIARFKLFSQNINGTIEDGCEIAVGGIPYNSLNNAMRINAGIDIANTLSDHYGVCAPMFLDNCEAVNDVLASKNQQIKLYVTFDNQLKIETEE